MPTITKRAEAELEQARRRLAAFRDQVPAERCLARLAVAAPRHPARWGATLCPGGVAFLVGVALGWTVLPRVSTTCAAMVGGIDPEGFGVPLLLSASLMTMAAGAVCQALALRAGARSPLLPEEKGTYDALSLAVWRAEQRVAVLRRLETAA